MTVWNVDKNAEAKTMVITAEFKAPTISVWHLWADPQQAIASGVLEGMQACLLQIDALLAEVAA